VLQSYHIIKKLGEGGMGAVYLGEHVKMGRKSAIKVMTQSLANDTDAIARFNREAANAASINHANVCAIYDFGETPDGTIFLAMEYIEGEALTDLVKREGPLDLKRAGAILKQTGDALQAAHELGIVHRDLKPDNIMIAKARDGSDLVKVVDFGIAKAMSGEEGQNVTRTGLVVGTPEYMSPEQLSGDKLDGRSDVYSLALVFFRMITGVLPFEADSAQEVMIKRLTDDPTRLNDALQGSSFSPELQQVMDRAMERMPSDRYASADEFSLAALDAIAHSPATAPPPVDTQGETQLLDTGATPPEVTEQLAKTRVSEAQATVAMGDTAHGEGVAAGASSTDRAAGGSEEEGATTPQTPMPQAGPEAPKKKKPVLAIAASIVVVGIVGGVAAVTMTGNGSDQPGTTLDTTQIATVPPNADSGNASQAGGESETQSGGEQETGGADRTTQQGSRQTELSEDSATGSGNDRVVAPPTTVDSVAIDDELFNIAEGLLDATRRTALMDRAQALYNNAAIPTYLRGQAAYTVALGYIEDGDMTSTCRWLDNAIGMDPNNSRFLSARTSAGCNR